ncbi:MAG: DUF1036 domain-containing protein [Sphaerospermopsis sp. SIO1G1]|nr:DUF1036 domain-containing protein [Sphaerospermopsis sp. SIO1G1]
MKKFLLSLGLTSLCTSIILLLQETPTYAWFKVCNKYSEKIQVVFGYQDTIDNRSSLKTKKAPWSARGWYTINPGRCIQVYGHELWRRNKYYYYYAKTIDGSVVWKPNKGEKGSSFCISSKKFDIVQSNLVKEKCSQGIVRKYYPGGRGRDSLTGLIYTVKPHYKTIATDTKWLRLKEIYVGRGKIQNYTLTLR